MSHYKPYPAYKDSGVEWLGKVPAHWNVLPLKYLVKAVSGGQATKNTVSSEPIDGHYPAFSASGQDVWMPEFEFDTSGIVLSAVGARCGKTFKADGKWGVVANTHCLFPKNEANRDYFWYLTNREDWWEKGGTAQPFVKVGETLDRKHCFPPKEEQVQIARALDRETARIDTLITKKTRFIELLREKRQALITHAVTKGLDPKVKMKDSGVEWLGEVPEHWRVSKLKHNLREQLTYGANEAAEQDDPENPRFIRITDMNEDGTLKVETFKSLPMDVALPYLLSDGDVLLARSGATVGKSFLYRNDMGLACYAGYLICARFDVRKVFSKYFWYITNSSYYWDFISGSNIQSTIQNVSGEKYGNLWIATPSLDEQAAIISKLDCEWIRFESLIGRTERSLELLKERRSALITAAVTGQIDLR